MWNLSHKQEVLPGCAQSQKGHYYDYRSWGPILACVWKDKRVIHFLSTIHVAKCEPPATVLRRNELGTQDLVECPPCLPDYQSFMRGVDKGDQLIGYYNIGRCSRKWWKRVFAYLVGVAILDAYVLHKHAHTGRDRLNYLDFRLKLAEELIGSFSGRAPMGRPRSSEGELDQLRLDSSLGHWPVCASKPLQCVVCNKVRERRGLPFKDYRHESKFTCSVCGVHLCITPDRDCFRKYHTQSYL